MSPEEQTESRCDPTRWVDLHGDVLYRFALARLGDPEQAEDTVQEALLAGLAGQDRFEGGSSERTWLVGILKHKIVDRLRRRAREQADPEVTDPQTGLEAHFNRHGLWREKPRGWGGSPDRALEDKEFWDVFRRCLSGLPPRLAEAFALRELDGLDSEKVRDVMDVSATNLWTLLHRARLHLRRCLEGGWFGEKRKRK